MKAIKNTVYQRLFRLKNETAATVSALILDHNDAVIATKVMQKKEAGYLFSHSFDDVGVFSVKVLSGGKTYYEAVTVELSVLDEIA